MSTIFNAFLVVVSLATKSTASELILEWGEARPEGPRAGGWVLGEGTASPSPPTKGFEGAL